MSKVAKAVAGGVLVGIGVLMNFAAPGSGVGFMKMGYGSLSMRDRSGRVWTLNGTRK